MRPLTQPHLYLTQGAILSVATLLLPYASTVTYLSLARLSLDRIPPEVTRCTLPASTALSRVLRVPIFLKYPLAWYPNAP